MMAMEFDQRKKSPLVKAEAINFARRLQIGHTGTDLEMGV